MADADPSVHRDQSGSSQIFGYTALALYGAFLLLPLQLASTGWALLGPEQAVIANLNLLRSVQREIKQRPDVLPSRRDLERLLAEPGAAPAVQATGENSQAAPASGVKARLGIQPRADVEPALAPLDRRRILASLDAALANRSASLRQRLLRGLQEQIPPMLRNLLQALLLLMAYSGASMNDPNKGSLLQQLQNSWLRARDDLVSNNQKQREDAADLQRLQEERKVREALRILRQAGEIQGSRRRHRGDPPPLDPSASSERAESGPAEPGS